jgi:cytoskeletal protein CcmA (bactofilin family)
MAIFNKSDKATTSGATVVAKGTKLKADMELECSLHMDGIFEGVINSKSDITIGKTGVVNGEIVANKVIVSGSFSGLIDADVIEILPDGKIYGKVVSREFMIEKNGIFEGESKLKNSDKALVKRVQTVGENKKIDLGIKEKK